MSRRLGKESMLMLEMLFPVTKIILVLVGKELGIASKSWFWHFTVSEEHKHLSGQQWQDSASARRTSKCIIPDLCAPPRLHPRDVLKGRIFGFLQICVRRAVRKDPAQSPPCSSAGESFPKCVCHFFSVRKLAPDRSTDSMELPPHHSRLGIRLHFHEDEGGEDGARKLLGILFVPFPHLWVSWRTQQLQDLSPAKVKPAGPLQMTCDPDTDKALCLPKVPFVTHGPAAHVSPCLCEPGETKHSSGNREHTIAWQKEGGALSAHKFL